MNNELKELFERDTDGLLTYEYMANHIEKIDSDIDLLTGHIIEVDRAGQLTVSAARYLNAIDPVRYADTVSHLISVAIDKDRERAYIGDLLTIWGPDYAEHIDELNSTDNNFRRIYKRLNPSQPI